jgi:hypothetical protein
MDLDRCKDLYISEMRATPLLMKMTWRWKAQMTMPDDDGLLDFALPK